MIIPFPGKPVAPCGSEARLEQLYTMIGRSLTAALAELERGDYRRATTLTLAAHNGLVELQRSKPK
jgi:hypothetical protein